MLSFDRVLIDGQWVRPHGVGHFDVVNPTTEEVCGRIPACDAEDADRAVGAARRAFTGWKLTPPKRRGELLLAIADAMDARAKELADLIVEELGAPAGMTAQYMVGFPANTLRFYGELLVHEKFAFEERIGNSLVWKEPRGVVAAITPWNYPIHQITAKVGPALAAGCTVVVKPATDVALSCFRFAELAQAAGLPPGVFNFLSGGGPEVGAPLVRHPDVDMVSFTGSTAVGRATMAAAAATVKDVSLELGGKAASVVLDDAPPEAIPAGVRHAYVNCGQTCAAWTRMLVPRARHDEACEIARRTVLETIEVGDPRVPPPAGKTRLGPLVSARQFERVRGYIQSGIDAGATLVTGGLERPFPRGYFVAPTIFGDVRPELAIAQEEIFGPVLTILPYDDEEHAIRLANSTIYGLGGAIWSRDVARALRVARRIDSGSMDINGGLFNQLAPFRGMKQSGIGAELGVYGLEEYLGPKALQLPIDGEIAHYLKA
jgi:betaine-aldehyde dehydrogenase